jgi:hypothetical protein
MAAGTPVAGVASAIGRTMTAPAAPAAPAASAVPLAPPRTPKDSPWPTRVHATIEIENEKPAIECLFNPADITITKGTNWNAPDAKGKNSRPLKFQQGTPAQMQLTLMFDTTKDGNPVTDYTNRLLSLTMVREKSKNSDGTKRPPYCQFVWGKIPSFKAVVKNLQLKFTYFSSQGVPLRAQATLTLEEYQDDPTWLQNPTSMTPSPHSVRQVLPGQTLDRIAAEVYGDPSKWRLIAERNNILDPLDLPLVPIAIPPLGVESRG